MSARLDQAVTGRRRAQMVANLRGLARTSTARDTPPARVESCDLCTARVPSDHRHLLNLAERQIVCVCESCWALRSGDPDLRPVGRRVVALNGFEMPEELWASFRIPIGLAFFLHSSVTECVVALYPSPAGATESELHFESWNELRALNPVLETLESDVEALIVNRLSDPPGYAIAPIDRCYGLVGLVKVSWEGISGGPRLAEAVESFFADLRAAAVTP